jgi:tripartite-type tricarboxylate transporter receptor subunit TctC
MNTKNMLKLICCAGLAVASLLPALARAEFPEKPITMIIPWAPGGSTDQTARALAKAAEAHLGKPVVVVNQPGASTTIGMGQISRAKPDGYTIGTMSSTSYLFPLGGHKVPYDPIKGFSYVSYYGDNLMGIAVMADKPWKTLPELIEAGKKQRLTYGTAGVGTTQHLTASALTAKSGAKFVHIPQDGSAGSMVALLGGHVDFSLETSVWLPYVQSKQVRLLALTTPERSSYFPDVPTFKENGFQSLRSIQAIVAPAGLPEPVRAKLESAFRRSLTDPGFVAAMKRLSMEIVDMPGKEVEALVQSEYTRAEGYIKDLKSQAASVPAAASAAK